MIVLLYHVALFAAYTDLKTEERDGTKTIITAVVISVIVLLSCTIITLTMIMGYIVRKKARRSPTDVNPLQSYGNSTHSTRERKVLYLQE